VNREDLEGEVAVLGFVGVRDALEVGLIEEGVASSEREGIEGIQDQVRRAQSVGELRLSS